LNLLKWPTNINKLAFSVFAPSRALLKTNVYDNKDQWLKDSLKLTSLHQNKNYFMFDTLWKRDEVQCYLCKDYYNLDEDQNKIVFQHKEAFKISKNNKIDNLTLCLESCNIDWKNSIYSVTKPKPNTN